MQANSNINNLFDGFENEFGKGDWNAIESKVIDNNRKYRNNRSKFKIGAAFGLVACLALGLIHFSTITGINEEEIKIAEKEMSNVPSFKENQLPISNTENNLVIEKPINVDEIVESNESIETASLIESEKLESIILKEEVLVPVNESILPQLPKFVMQKTTYCIGEKLEFVSSIKSTRTLSVNWDNKEMSLDDFKQIRLSSAGSTVLYVVENGKIIQEHTVVCQAPMARIGYKKNYEVNNPYVHFNAMNTPENADFKWYVDGEVIASAVAFEHTFASKGMYSIKLVMESSGGCKDSSIKSVRILRGYNLMATTVYNPKEGKWLPLGLKKEGVNFRLRIIDQEGQTVFTSNNSNNEWNGAVDGNKQVSNGDLFYWVAQVTDLNGKISEYGNSLLINSELE